jgi:hypothetical protein
MIPRAAFHGFILLDEIDHAARDRFSRWELPRLAMIPISAQLCWFKLS